MMSQIVLISQPICNNNAEKANRLTDFIQQKLLNIEIENLQAN